MTQQRMWYNKLLYECNIEYRFKCFEKKLECIWGFELGDMPEFEGTILSWITEADGRINWTSIFTYWTLLIILIIFYFKLSTRLLRQEAKCVYVLWLNNNKLPFHHYWICVNSYILLLNNRQIFSQSNLLSYKSRSILYTIMYVNVLLDDTDGPSVTCS